MVKKEYILPYKERRRLYDRASRAQQRDQSEVCGLLIVDNDKRIGLWFLKNISENSGKYRIDLNEVKAARNHISQLKKKILGSFHSHPITEATPGTGDLKGGFYYGVEMIYDVCGREAKLWRIQKRGAKQTAKELPLIMERRASYR